MTNEDSAKPRSSAPPETGDMLQELAGRIFSGVFSNVEGETWRDHCRRIWIGACGGLVFSFILNATNGQIGLESFIRWRQLGAW